MTQDHGHPKDLEWAEEEPISDENFAIIGKVILDWGSADSTFSLILGMMLKFDPEDLKDFVYGLTTERKIAIIKKKTKHLGDKEIDFALSEASFCLQNFQIQRNILAHGLAMWGQDGKPMLIHFRQEAEIAMSDLRLVLERSKYIAAIPKFIAMKLGGLTPKPLPARPQ